VRSVLTLAVLCLLLPASARAATGVALTSDAGDDIGRGSAYQSDPAAKFIATGYAWAIEGAVAVKRPDGSTEHMSWRFAAPIGSRLRAGQTYANARRIPFQGAAPGMEVTVVEGAGCNLISGSFTISEISFARGRLRTLAMSFEQHCEEKAPALRGTIAFHAGEPSPPRPQGTGKDTVLATVHDGAARADAAADAFYKALKRFSRANLPAIKAAYHGFATEIATMRHTLAVAHPESRRERREQRAWRPLLHRIASSLHAFGKGLADYEAGRHPRAAVKAMTRALKRLSG
jgi:hypothetical protein